MFVVLRSTLFSLVCAAVVLFWEDGRAQSPGGADSARFAIPADSLRVYDSAYHARKALLDQWIHEQRKAASPQEDFLSVYAEYGAYLQILPRDINQLFSERTLRPDHTADRNAYGTVDRAILLGGAAQLSKSWGIYVEYDFTAKFLNTIVDDSARGPQSLAGIEEALDLSEHAFVVGGMFMLYSSRVYRLRASGGFGAVIALTSETEAGGATRSASATGYQANFDLLNDFRIVDNASFTLDFLARTVSTSTLKTPEGTTLDAPFGRGPRSVTVAPNASNVVYGFAAGLVYYF